jgi:Arc/MetJ-type ribon-helix-helix transcriptional regulator
VTCWRRSASRDLTKLSWVTTLKGLPWLGAVVKLSAPSLASLSSKPPGWAGGGAAALVLFRRLAQSIRDSEYDWSMKLKTSVTLGEDVVAALERSARDGESRSETVERLLRLSLAAEARAKRDRRDRDLINTHADELNAEAADVLAYQVDV